MNELFSDALIFINMNIFLLLLILILLFILLFLYFLIDNYFIHWFLLFKFIDFSSGKNRGDDLHARSDDASTPGGLGLQVRQRSHGGSWTSLGSRDFDPHVVARV
jgi:hypothetical protein